MSWEDQGRQEHGRFGNGTSGDEAAVAERGADIVAGVGQAAVAALGVAAGRDFGSMLDQGGMADLRDALPVWTSAAGMSPERFRAVVVGPGFTAAGAAALQAAGQALSDGGDDAGVVAVAGAHLAAAFAGVSRENQGYALNYAADVVRYVLASGTVSDSHGINSAKAAVSAATASNPSRDCYAECAHLLRSASGDIQNSEYRKCYRECVGSLGG